LTSLAIKHNITKEQVSQEEIGEIEEANWELLEGQNAKTLSQKMDVFFKDYPEEELLVFIEDLCADEEEEDITGPGAELMVIGLKTIADALFLPANY
jgi:spore cortex formation protein SpoVR/YcgB (stage V sporulation)